MQGDEVRWLRRSHGGANRARHEVQGDAGGDFDAVVVVVGKPCADALHDPVAGASLLHAEHAADHERVGVCRIAQTALDAAAGFAQKGLAATKPKGMTDDVFAKVRSELGPIAVLVTSAGLFDFPPFTEISTESWARIVDVNLTGTFHCCQIALPDMLDAKWGRIVMISSSSAQRQP